MRNWVGILVIALTLAACGSLDEVKEGTTSFYFGEPQPAESPSETEFPTALIGTYTSKDDSTLSLFITNSSIYVESPLIFFVTQAELDTNADLFIRDNMLHGMKENEPLHVETQGDTFYAVYPHRTSVFELGPEEKLGKMEENYFLNYLSETGMWTTVLLRLNAQNQLSMESIDHDPVLKTIQEFERTEKKKLDPFLTYIAYPTPLELKQLIDMNAFADPEIYQRTTHE